MDFLCDVAPDGEIKLFRSHPEQTHGIVSARAHMKGEVPPAYLSADMAKLTNSQEGGQIVFYKNDNVIGQEYVKNGHV
jgi:hypothetical protein